MGCGGNCPPASSYTLPVKLSWKILSLKRIGMVFNLSKKDPATRRALKTKLSVKSFGKFLRQRVCVGIPLLQNFRSVAYFTTDFLQKIFRKLVVLKEHFSKCLWYKSVL